MDGLRYLTVDQCTAYFHLSRTSVLAHIKDGTLKASKFKRTWRVLDPGPNWTPPAPLDSEQFVDELCWIRTCEIAAFLGHNITYIKQLARAGKLRHKMIRGKRLYPFSAILDRLRARYTFFGKDMKKVANNGVRPEVLCWIAERMAHHKKQGTLEVPAVVAPELYLPTLEEMDVRIREIAALEEPGRTEAYEAFMLSMLKELQRATTSLRQPHRPPAPLAR